jgi:hypothetical protein
LTGFLDRLFVTVGKAAELSVELGLKLRSNAVDNPAQLFLGH